MSAAVETGPVTLVTRDGVVLSGLVEAPDGPVRALASVAHPHPLYGGDSTNPVVVALAAGLRAAGVATLRFDFRGVGRSSGSHGGGPAERDDVTAALDHLAALDPTLPLLVAGYSFGADVSLTVEHDGVAGWITVAPPLRLFPAEQFCAGHDDRPTHLLVPEHDQFCPPQAATEATVGWAATTITPIPMADHFGAGAGRITTDLAQNAAVATLAPR